MLANMPAIKEDGILVKRIDNHLAGHGRKERLREHPKPPREQPFPQRGSLRQEAGNNLVAHSTTNINELKAAEA